MDVNNSLELPQIVETALPERAQAVHTNRLLLWLGRVKTSTAILILCATDLLAYANSFTGNCELGLFYEKLGRKAEAVSTLKHAYSLSKDQALRERIATNLNKITAAVP